MSRMEKEASIAVNCGTGMIVMGAGMSRSCAMVATPTMISSWFEFGGTNPEAAFSGLK